MLGKNAEAGSNEDVRTYSVEIRKTLLDTSGKKPSTGVLMDMGSS